MSAIRPVSVTLETFDFASRSQILFRSFALIKRFEVGGGALVALKLCRKKCLNVIMVLFLLWIPLLLFSPLGTLGLRT
jgi:hypothetical protein